MLAEAWCIELFGALKARLGTVEITRFRSYRTGALLAYLACYRNRTHPREELIELLWPESEPEAGQMSLRTALSSLRRQLEPPGVPPGSVLVADRSQVRLNPPAFTTDVAEFEAALRSAAGAEDPAERSSQLGRAVELYQGPLLPGYYEDWVQTERERLEAAFVDAARDLVVLLARGEDRPAGIRRALEVAHRAVVAAPLREGPHLALVRLYEAAGQPAVALRHYEELERLLREELDAAPSAAARAIAARLRAATLPEAREQRSRGAGEQGRRGAREQGRRGAGEQEGRRAGGQASKGAGGQASRREGKVEGSGAPLRPPLVDPLRGGPPLRASNPLVTALAPLPPRDAPARLPPSLNRFFGRAAEMQALLQLLQPLPPCTPASPDAVRVVTLTGPGGTGKTRLALEAARRLEDGFGAARWFVPLADLADARLIPGAVLDAMGVVRSPDSEPVDQVAALLDGRPALLVLDNFEQLAPAGTAVVLRLLQRVPELTCLVTSRRRLALPGERQVPLAPLPVPADPPLDSSVPPDPETLFQFPSVQLFADRAQGVRPDFQVTRGNAPAVAALCERLEGIPLAIELAAARAQSLTPAQMLERLEERFDLLARRGAVAEERHRSLWAAIDWSYHLLTAEQQRFFARLSVFRGGCAPEAAAEVCEEPAALEYLAQLRERSLVVGEEVELPPELRFRMLESLRDYAWEQLSPEERCRLPRRHAEYFLELTRRAEPELMGPEQAAWLGQLQTEHDNLRAAISACVALGGRPRGCPRSGRRQGAAAGGDSGDRQRRSGPIPNTEHRIPNTEHQTPNPRMSPDELALRLAASLFRFWLMRGFLTEGREHLAKVLACTAEDPTFPRAKALNSAGALAQHQGDSAAAQAYYEESLAILRQVGNPTFIAAILGNLGTLAYRKSDYRAARGLMEESTAIRREVGDQWGIANNLNVLGMIAGSEGNSSLADECYAESLSLFQELGDRHNVALVLGNQASVAMARGEDALAESLYEQALALYREMDDREDITIPLRALGEIACRRGEPEAAASYLQEGLAIARKAASRPGMAPLLATLAELALRSGDHAAAGAHLRESLTIYRDMGNRQGLSELLAAIAHLAAVRSKGRHCPQRAARLFGAAEALREQIGAARAPAERAEHERRVAAARDCGLSGPAVPQSAIRNRGTRASGSSAMEVWAAAWAEGRAMSVEAAVAEALEESP